MKIKKGDLVQVISGRSQKNGGDRGKQGKVIEVYPRDPARARRGHQPRHQARQGRRDRPWHPTGGLTHTEAAIHVSNVAIVDPESKKPTRVKTRVETVERNGRQKASRVRVAVKSDKDL